MTDEVGPFECSLWQIGEPCHLHGPVPAGLPTRRERDRVPTITTGEEVKKMATTTELTERQKELEKRNEKIVSELRKGTVVSQIAEKFDLSVARIYELATAFGINVAKPVRAKKVAKKAS